MENRPGARSRSRGFGVRSAHREFQGRIVRIVLRDARVRELTWIPGELPDVELRPGRAAGGEAERIHGTGLLVHVFALGVAAGARGGRGAPCGGTGAAAAEPPKSGDAKGVDCV